MLIFPIVSCIVSALALLAMLAIRRSLPLDLPNHRSLHKTPIPRTGGLAIMLGAGCGWVAAWPTTGQFPMLALTITLSAFSLIDDFRGLSVVLRLGVQILAATALLWLMPPFPAGIIGYVLALAVLVWMANLFNFMDGSDGLAGGMAAFGFGAYALAAYQDGQTEFAVTAACFTGASIAFLWFNFNPAKIFMGDSGSVPLGFLAAAMGLAGLQSGIWPIAFPILVFSVFIVDASVTLVKRLVGGRKVWQAHREHYYQRLIRMGLGHRNTALLEYGLMLASGLSAFAIRHSTIEAQIVMMMCWVAAYGLFLYCIDRAWEKHSREYPSS